MPLPVRLSFAVSVALTLALGAVPRSPAADAPVARAVPAQGAVRIDGLLNEPSWALGQWSTGFRNAGSGADNAGDPRPAVVQTRFKVLCDRANLYVGVECDEPKLDGLLARASSHDGPVEVY